MNKVTIEEKRILFWPDKGKEEEAVAIIREMYEDSGFNTDRCWAKEGGKLIYGTRVFLRKKKLLSNAHKYVHRLQRLAGLFLKEKITQKEYDASRERERKIFLKNESI